MEKHSGIALFHFSSVVRLSATRPLATSLSLVILLLTLGSCSTGPTRLSREILVKPPPIGVDSKTQVPTETVAAQNPPSTTDAVAGQAHFEWPVEDARFVRGFLPQKRRPHWGVDLAASRGTPIYSAQTGMVIYAGRDFKGYGKMVLIESGTGWATLYAHMDKILVDEGQTVTTKDVLGLMGRTGRATGVHLHFEIRRGKGPVDPLEYLPGGTRIAGRI